MKGISFFVKIQALYTSTFHVRPGWVALTVQRLGYGFKIRVGFLVEKQRIVRNAGTQKFKEAVL